MSLATERDEVLTRLSEVAEIDLAGDEFIFPEPTEQRFSDMFFKHRFVLEHDGYIEYHESDAVLIDVQRARILPLGVVFLRNGGYTAIEQNIQAQEERALAEEKQKRSEWNWKRFYESATLVVAIGGLIFVGLPYFTTPKSGNVEKRQSQIDTVKKETEQLQVDTVRKETKKLLKPNVVPSVK